MHYSPISFKEKLKKFNDHWAPKVIAEMNDYQFKLVKFKGEFVRHKHVNTDETFIVIEGSMKIQFDNDILDLHAGEMFVIPKNVEHKPYAEEECHVMLIEPKGIVNTGDAGGELTAENDVWV